MVDEVRQRLDALAPLFADLGARTLQAYTAAGIPAAVAEASFPIADASFARKQERYIYHLHGPAYLFVNRRGELQLAGQEAGSSFLEKLAAYVRLGREQDLEGSAAVEGATEWFPPPRFLLAEETSRLYIASVSAHTRQLPGPGFELLADYVEERAGQFVAGFRQAQSS